MFRCVISFFSFFFCSSCHCRLVSADSAMFYACVFTRDQPTSLPLRLTSPVLHVPGNSMLPRLSFSMPGNLSRGLAIALVLRQRQLPWAYEICFLLILFCYALFSFFLSFFYSCVGKITLPSVRFTFSKLNNIYNSYLFCWAKPKAVEGNGTKLLRCWKIVENSFRFIERGWKDRLGWWWSGWWGCQLWRGF